MNEGGGRMVERGSALRMAVVHAVAWLFFANSVGLYLAWVQWCPRWAMAGVSYGRLVPVHLNVQLYGWVSLVLVAWLFSMYEVGRSRGSGLARVSVSMWSASLAVGVCTWVGGLSTGKIFLDWRQASLWGYVLALVVLWHALYGVWKELQGSWEIGKRWSTGLGLLGLMMVPISLVMATKPTVYPPIDVTTGGPTGASLLGSTMVVVVMMLWVPRVAKLEKLGVGVRGVWWWVVVSWLCFGVCEGLGGTHRDWYQLAALAVLLPWFYGVWREWRAYRWPDWVRGWKVAVLVWWAVLLVTGYGSYLPEVLDRLKFTQGLVAHSHIAMGGFAGAFCGLLASLCLGRGLGSPLSRVLWHSGLVGMIVSLLWMGWVEGSRHDWMIQVSGWREIGLGIRWASGVLVWVASGLWFQQLIKER